MSDSQFTTNGDIRIHFEVIGKGPPLVLQHGFTQNTKRWHLHGYVDALKESYQLILIDARGHGKSDKPHETDRYQSPVMATDTLAVLDALDIRRARYWGFSMGGRIGFELASLAPDRICAYVLGGSHPFERDGVVTTADKSDPETFVRAFLDRIGVKVDSVPAAIRDDFLRNDFKALACAQPFRPSVAGGLTNMARVPALIYGGDADPIHLDSKRCVPSLPDAEFVWLPGLDHGTSFRRAELILPQAKAVLAAANA